jgi:hypothetical protein
MNEHDELRSLVRQLNLAERESPFAFTKRTTLAEAAEENGAPMFLIHGSSKDGEIRYTAGPYTVRAAAERVRAMLAVTVGD